MIQTNETVLTLFARFPAAKLDSDEQRQILNSLKTRFAQASDAAEELKKLYGVKGFSDFASVIMWLLERAKKDPELTAKSPADEALLLSSFRKAMAQQGKATTPAKSSGAEAQDDDEKRFAAHLEKLSESVQGGADGRSAELEGIFNECEVISAGPADPEFKQFTILMADFLKYTAENELLDDIRVINIVSNISSSISQWAIASAGDRHGLMEEALGMLRDFRTHFE